MEIEKYAAVVQTCAVLVAVAAIVVALRNGAVDRRAADRRAEADRADAASRASADHEKALKRASADHATARWEAEKRWRLDLLLRLTQNLERGGATDPQEVQRLGAERDALILALGPDVVPGLYSLRGSPEHMETVKQELAEIEPEDWTWAQEAAEAGLALRRIAEERPPSGDLLTVFDTVGNLNPGWPLGMRQPSGGSET